MHFAFESCQKKKFAVELRVFGDPLKTYPTEIHSAFPNIPNIHKGFLKVHTHTDFI